jgi:hypothetical protein
VAPVAAAPAAGVADDQPGVLEDLQVLRDGRPADREADRKFADRARAIGEPLEDRASGAVPERGPPFMLVSLHARLVYAN